MIGVIDIGSNSVRLMLLSKTYKKKYVETTGLAKGSLDGYLKVESMERTVNAITNFVNFAKDKTTKVYIFATEAVRSSKNKEDFISLVKSKTGIELTLIPANKEAEMGFKGCYTTGTNLVLDIGGASTEIVVGDSEKICYQKSVPIGVVRINDKVLSGADKNEYIDSMLSTYGAIPKADEYYAIGGTAGTIAAINEQLEVYDTNITHGYKLTKDIVDYWQKKFEKMTVKEISELKGIDKKRAEIIEGGTNLLFKVMEMLNIDHMLVSENDNLEGFVKCYNIPVEEI